MKVPAEIRAVPRACGQILPHKNLFSILDKSNISSKLKGALSFLNELFAALTQNSISLSNLLVLDKIG